MKGFKSWKPKHHPNQPFLLLRRWLSKGRRVQQCDRFFPMGLVRFIWGIFQSIVWCSSLGDEWNWNVFCLGRLHRTRWFCCSFHRSSYCSLIFDKGRLRLFKFKSNPWSEYWSSIDHSCMLNLHNLRSIQSSLQSGNNCAPILMKGEMKTSSYYVLCSMCVFPWCFLFLISSIIIRKMEYLHLTSIDPNINTHHYNSNF